MTSEESTRGAPPGRVSWATRDRLGDAFRLSERGLVPIKGAGEVRAFWPGGRA